MAWEKVLEKDFNYGQGVDAGAPGDNGILMLLGGIVLISAIKKK